MKRNIFYIIIFFFLSATTIRSQSTDQNYILTRTWQDENATRSVDVIQYFDGLGYLVETVQKGITPTGADLVSLTKYDGMGREKRKYLPLPYANNNGAYVSASYINSFITSGCPKPYYNNDTKPYSEIQYEPSPLNRISNKYGPGQDWSNHPVNNSYDTNDGNIAYFYVNNGGNLQRGTNFTAGSLYKTVITDEDGKSVTEFKDKIGQTVLIRNGSDINTYYVYNDLGQLCYVLPPLAADNLTSQIVYYDDNDILRKYAYLYKYDERGNCIMKRLPGCDWIYMVYDKARRLILSQDGNQRNQAQQKWTLTKYDNLGRILYTTEITLSDSLNGLVSYFKNYVVTETFTVGSQPYPMGDTGYSRGWYHLTPYKLLTVNYYDNYNFLATLPTTEIRNKLAYDSSKVEEYGKKYSSAQGLLTGTRTYLLDGSGSYTVTAIYYDDRGRIVQSRSTNHLGGYDITYNQYDFTDKVIKTLKEHNIAGQATPLRELYTYTYDNAQRPLVTTYSLNGGTAVILINNTGGYDEVGRLITKKRHNNTDTESFAYNIRNWLTRITSGTFQEQLYYNTLPTGASTSPCYNGNIAYSVTGNTNSMPMRSYAYSYDNLNRLTVASGYYFPGFQSSSSGNNEIFYHDKMGNITFLLRTGNTTMDFLSLSYNGNQLKYVNDYGGNQNSYYVKEYQNKSNTQDEFSYDANGNMIKDLDRDILTIRYNLLNLPDTIQFKNGNQIINQYDAAGRKLSTRYYTILIPEYVPLINTLTPGKTIKLAYNMDIIDETGTFYVDNVEYKFNGCDPGFYMLDRVHNSEGYVENLSASSGPTYNYYRRDHLGNNREVWRANTNTTVQRTQYYPSGLPWATSSSDNPGLQPYKYNGKEFVEMHGYDTYDYGARGMYPAIMRFTTLDPLAEKYYSISPYAYCGDNPIMRIDPDGMDWYRNDETGATFWQKGNANFVDKDDVKYRNIGETYSTYSDGIKTNYGNNGSLDVIGTSEVDPSLNLKGGEFIPKQFTTDDGQKVNVSFSSSSNNAINSDAVSGLIKSINEANNGGANITSINVSSTTNHPSNAARSAHTVANGARAIDISKINNVPVSKTDTYSPALQQAIGRVSGWLENYGPSIIQKMNNGTAISAPWAREIKGGHYDHIHYSVPRR